MASGDPSTRPPTSNRLHEWEIDASVTAVADIEPPRPIVIADGRGRISLTRHGGIRPGQIFVIDIGPGGVILLTPATAVPIGSTNRPTS